MSREDLLRGLPRRPVPSAGGGLAAASAGPHLERDRPALDDDPLGGGRVDRSAVGVADDVGHAVLVRGMPYVVCDTDGNPVDPATAKRIIVECWTVPLEVRARRRSRKPATSGGDRTTGKAPQQVLAGHERSDARGADERGGLPRRTSSAAIPEPVKRTPVAAAGYGAIPAEAAGRDQRAGHRPARSFPCPGPAGTRGSRAGAAGPAGTRSALDPRGAGPYQRPAADPLDKPAPIGNQRR